MKLPLERPKKSPWLSERLLAWRSCAPFVENTRAVLVHRPRTVQTVNIHKEPHLAIHYWCGNGVAGRRNLTLLDTLAPDELVCAVCEERAVKAGLPSATSLVGRHVHIGGVVAVRHCCQDHDTVHDCVGCEGEEA